MNPLRAASLGRRLLIGQSLGLLLTGVLLLLCSAWAMKQELDEQLDIQLGQTADLLLRLAPLHRDGQLVRGTAADRQGRAPWFLVEHQSEVVMRSPDAPPRLDDLALRPGLQTREWQGRRWRVLLRQVDEYRVGVAEDQARRLVLVREAFESWPWLGALSLAALLLLTAWGLRRALRPLLWLEAAVRARRVEALDPLQPPELPSELQPVVQALNGLFERIATQREHERRFTADAAHELRTPIAALRAQAEVAQGAEERPAERRRALQAVLRACDRAAHLVDQMLTLARLDGTEGDDAGAAVDLAVLARALCAELLDAYPDRTADLELIEPPSGVTPPWPGSALLLRLLLRNLIDNALRYSRPGQPVRVMLGAQELSVEDGGAGMDEDALRQLGLRRFWRGASASGTPGSGLGWSIVRRCADQLGLRLEAQRSPLGGLAARVRRA